MKKRIVKLLSFFFSALFVISLLPMSISAGYTIESTDVFSDLEAMEGFDLSEYPKNEKSDFCSVIAFHEYGYDYNRRKNDYGLYVYVYNPSADPIFNSKDNKIGFDRFGDGSVTKYNLILLSSSVKEGYEHVFYKFKVDVDDDFYRRLSPSCRRYAVLAHS